MAGKKVQIIEDSRERVKMPDRESQLSVCRQCKLLNIHRSVAYCQPGEGSGENQTLMRLIDRQHLEDPAAEVLPPGNDWEKYQREAGSPFDEGDEDGGSVSAGADNGSGWAAGDCPVFAERYGNQPCANQVWPLDITYIPMRRGFMYLFAVIDWYSRKVLSWELSDTLDMGFCLRGGLRRTVPEYGKLGIVDAGQGCQFTSGLWRKYLVKNGIRQSTDGRGRGLDNVVIERFGRTLKNEDIYLKLYENPVELGAGLGNLLGATTCAGHTNHWLACIPMMCIGATGNRRHDIHQRRLHRRGGTNRNCDHNLGFIRK